MTGFVDLVERAHPALARFPDRITADVDASWAVANPNDNEGNVIDLTSAVGECTIVDAIGGTTLATPTFVGDVDYFQITVPAATTTSLAPGGSQRNAYWSLIVTLAGAKVPFWIAADSPLVIYPAH